MERMALKIDGMSCGHCVATVTKALNAVTGVTVERVTVGSATVDYDPSVATPSGVASAVAKAGYPAVPAAA